MRVAGGPRDEDIWDITGIARALSVPVNSFFEARDLIERVVQKGVESPLSLITHPCAFRLLRPSLTHKGH